MIITCMLYRYCCNSFGKDFFDIPCIFLIFNWIYGILLKNIKLFAPSQKDIKMTKIINVVLKY